MNSVQGYGISNYQIGFQSKFGKSVKTLKEVKMNSSRLLKEKQKINKEIEATNKELSETIQTSLNGNISDKESFDMVMKLSKKLQELNFKKDNLAYGII